jgi:hypothetical protein
MEFAGCGKRVEGDRQVLTIAKAKWLILAGLFASFIAPTFISYQPYLFRWDDSEYLSRSIEVSRAFWSGNVHELRDGMVSIRPPAMTMLGLPWGPMTSWDRAGYCFVTLAAAISLLAALCLYLLLRIGVETFFIVAASVCVCASLGPFPAIATAHSYATAFLADSLFAWTSFAAVLLIPYEARTRSPEIRSAVLRGILWGSVLSLGVMTKINFLYFVVLILPAVLFIKSRYDGLRSALAAFIAFVCCSASSAYYLIRFGGPIFWNLRASSFGQLAQFFFTPLTQYLDDTFRESPGLVFSFVLMIAALVYGVIRRRRTLWGPGLPALLIVIGFGIVVLASPNREIRFAFPVIVALPFLVATLISRAEHPLPRSSSAYAAGLAFVVLLAVSLPTHLRADKHSLSRCDAVLALAAQYDAKRVVLATDSPTLNYGLIELDREVSGSKGTTFDYICFSAVFGVPIERDFQAIGESDMVVFQDKDALYPPFTNQRVAEYEQYVRQAGSGPIRGGGDISVYLMH